MFYMSNYKNSIFNEYNKYLKYTPQITIMALNDYNSAGRMLIDYIKGKITYNEAINLKRKYKSKSKYP